MNIFALSSDPQKAAQYHVNSHVVKMSSESRQMLSTALHITLPKRQVESLSRQGMWKPTHPNHPSNAWARASLSNWLWLRELAMELLDEHQFRYGLNRLEMREGIRLLPKPPIDDLGLQAFSLAMPVHYQQLDLSPVLKYRVFYANDKSHLFAWKRREPPAWMPTSILPNTYAMQRRFGTLSPPPNWRAQCP